MNTSVIVNETEMIVNENPVFATFRKLIVEIK